VSDPLKVNEEVGECMYLEGSKDVSILESMYKPTDKVVGDR
jgi:hypothetical protein